MNYHQIFIEHDQVDHGQAKIIISDMVVIVNGNLIHKLSRPIEGIHIHSIQFIKVVCTILGDVSGYTNGEPNFFYIVNELLNLKFLNLELPVKE